MQLTLNPKFDFIFRLVDRKPVSELTSSDAFAAIMLAALDFTDDNFTDMH